MGKDNPSKQAPAESKEARLDREIEVLIRDIVRDGDSRRASESVYYLMQERSALLSAIDKKDDAA